MQQLLVGKAFLIAKALQSHSDTPHLAGILWKSDKSKVETFPTLNTQHSNETGGIQNRNQ
jgi:hypothetical protein